MKLTATYTVDGFPDPVTVTTRPVDVMRWEARTKKRVTDGLGMAETARIVWEAAARLGILAPEHAASFDAWSAALAELTLTEGATVTPPPPDPEPSDT